MDLSKLQEVLTALVALQAQIDLLKVQGADAAAQLEAEKALSYAQGKADGDKDGYEKGKKDGYDLGFADGKASNPEDTTPFNQADVDAKIAEAVKPLNDQIAALQSQIDELKALPSVDEAAVRADEREKAKAAYVEIISAFFAKEAADENELLNQIKA